MYSLRVSSMSVLLIESTLQNYLCDWFALDVSLHECTMVPIFSRHWLEKQARAFVMLLLGDMLVTIGVRATLALRSLVRGARRAPPLDVSAAAATLMTSFSFGAMLQGTQPLLAGVGAAALVLHGALTAVDARRASTRTDYSLIGLENSVVTVFLTMGVTAFQLALSGLPMALLDATWLDSASSVNNTLYFMMIGPLLAILVTICAVAMTRLPLLRKPERTLLFADRRTIVDTYALPGITHAHAVELAEQAGAREHHGVVRFGDAVLVWFRELDAAHEALAERRETLLQDNL